MREAEPCGQDPEAIACRRAWHAPAVMTIDFLSEAEAATNGAADELGPS